MEPHIAFFQNNGQRIIHLLLCSLHNDLFIRLRIVNNTCIDFILCEGNQNFTVTEIYKI